MGTHYLYNTWAQIKQRCYNPNSASYIRYGARGIKLCEEWRYTSKGFCKWIDENLGPRPDDHTLDRIDNLGNYEPGNLRWASRRQQNRNRRPMKLNEVIVSEIRCFLNFHSDLSMRVVYPHLQKLLGISKSLIRDIRKHEKWKGVEPSENYPKEWNFKENKNVK